MKNIKAIYHCNNFKLASELGFTHVGISLTGYPGGFVDTLGNIGSDLSGAYNRMFDVMSGRTFGLRFIIAPFGHANGRYFTGDALEFLYKLKSYGMIENSKDIVYLPDEPNLYNIPRKDLSSLVYNIKLEFKSMETMQVLSWVKSYSGYENITDITGFDYYKKLDTWRKIKLASRVKLFMLKSKKAYKNFCAVPCIKYSPEHLLDQHKFWKSLCINNFNWYSWTPNQDKEDDKYWLDESLDKLPDYQKILKQINA